MFQARLSRPVSIHAPVKERRYLKEPKKHLMRFNSRSREGATITDYSKLGRSCCFNSRSREGATIFLILQNKGLSFNSRSREGATSLLPNRARLIPCFNSRSREGATCLDCVPVCFVSFNSRSREGATCFSTSGVFPPGFQFTLP